MKVLYYLNRDTRYLHNKHNAAQVKERIWILKLVKRTYMSLNSYNRNTDRVNFSIITTEAERVVLGFERSK